MKKTMLFILSILLPAILLISCSNRGTNEKKGDGHAVGIYKSFEELAASATDIIKGKCIDVKNTDGKTEYEFSVTKRYRGEDVGNIFVAVPDYSVGIGDSLSYRPSDIVYDVGSEYYLFLLRYVSVYTEHDTYINVGGNLFIPADRILESTLYGEPLSKHSKISKLAIQSSYVGYMKNVADAPHNERKYIGSMYINSTDVATVISQSKFVLKVKIGEEVDAGMATDRNSFKCTVTAVMKGNNISIDEEIYITFMKDTVQKDGEYIVALAETGENLVRRYFTLSSKNSVFSTAEYDVISDNIE